MKMAFLALMPSYFFLFFLLRSMCTCILQAKLETKALKAKRPGFTDERYHETSYYIENGELFEPFCCCGVHIFSSNILLHLNSRAFFINFTVNRIPRYCNFSRLFLTFAFVFIFGFLSLFPFLSGSESLCECKCN